MYEKVNNNNRKEIVKCKKVDENVSPASISVNNKDKNVYIDYYVYTDAKCTKTANVNTGSRTTLSYDKKDPVISKACYKNSNVILSATDDGLSEYAIINRTGVCSKAKREEIWYIHLKALKNYEAKVTSTKNLKVCVWDYAGNVESKIITKCK